MKTEVERCPFVNTSRARHTDAILLSRSRSILFWLFSQDFLLYILIFCIQGNIFLSLVCLSLSAIVSLMSLLSHGGNVGCFTRLRFKGACLLTTAR